MENILGLFASSVGRKLMTRKINVGQNGGRHDVVEIEAQKQHRPGSATAHTAS